jgi:monoamine oxidase
MTTDDSGRRAAPLTRRGFIEQLGLGIGGSALVMSAMRSWELMAQSAGPRPVYSGRSTGTKVIILGAGISGMTTAYELGKLGYNVSILEARDRVGGVNYTARRGSTPSEKSRAS